MNADSFFYGCVPSCQSLEQAETTHDFVLRPREPRFKHLLTKGAEPIGTKASVCLDPDRFVQGDGGSGCGAASFVLACFQLRLHLDKGLMQPDERLYRFPCL